MLKEVVNPAVKVTFLVLHELMRYEPLLPSAKKLCLSYDKGKTSVPP